MKIVDNVTLASDDGTRATREVFGGYACYVADSIDGTMATGTHVGVVYSEADRDTFLAGAPLEQCYLMWIDGVSQHSAKHQAATTGRVVWTDVNS